MASMSPVDRTSVHPCRSPVTSPCWLLHPNFRNYYAGTSFDFSALSAQGSDSAKVISNIYGSGKTGLRGLVCPPDGRQGHPRCPGIFSGPKTRSSTFTCCSHQSRSSLWPPPRRHGINNWTGRALPAPHDAARRGRAGQRGTQKPRRSRNRSVLHHADSSTSLYTSSFISHSRLSPAPAFRKRLNGLVNFTPPTRIMEFTLNMVLSASCTYRRSVSLPVTQPRKENQWPRTTCQPFSKVCPAKTTSFSSTSATPLRRANQTGPSILISSSATRKATIWSAESVLANSARVEDCDGRTLLCCTRQFCSRM
mmetsp:Transcript_4673/g.13720  ORF Transcript_4673/g.13720 Transcript_4673/m.13720 type:complete len:309 (-) Transcript_4673:1594-2520(-)